MIQQASKINPRVTLSKVKPKLAETEYVDESISTDVRRRIDDFYQAWLSLSTWRENRRKWAMYYNGDQLKEYVTDDSGNTVFEDEYISAQGKVPLKQNLIKSVFNSIVGQFRSDRGKTVIMSRTRDKAKETEMLTNALQSALEHNDVKELDHDSLVERLISGLPIQRISFGYWPEERRFDAFVENIHPNNMFFNGDVEDVRWKDLRLVGRLVDTTLDSLLIAFGKKKAQADVIKDIYGRRDPYKYWSNYETFDDERKHRMDFYMPDDDNKCRVIEAWELKAVKVIVVHDWAQGKEFEFDGTMNDVRRINLSRIQKYAMAGIPETEVPLWEAKEEYRQRWFYGYYSPWGHIIEEGETPYWHGSHPFVFGPKHAVDGKMTGLVHDLYDQQRQINRLLQLQDFILGTSAKNTLVIDEGSLNGQDPADIAEDYRRVGGVIVLKLKDGAKPPFELGRGVANLGINDMIQVQLKLIQDISGVHPSLQGQQAQSGTPASRVITEAQNSTINLKPILEPFNTFRKDRNEKVLKVIQQFYNEPRWLAISGSGYDDTARLYNPEAVRDVEFDLSIAQSADSPVYRNIIEESLKEFLMNGMIDIETYLVNSSLPYAETLLESIRNRRNEMQQNPQGAIQGMQQDPNLQGNPQAQAMMMQAIKGR